MAADDAPKPEDELPEADPWADIVADGLGDADGFEPLESLAESAVESLGSVADADAPEEAESLPDVLPFGDAMFGGEGAFEAAREFEGETAFEGEIAFEGDLEGEIDGPGSGVTAGLDTSNVADGFDEVVTSAGVASTVEIGTGFSGIDFEEPDGLSDAHGEAGDDFPVADFPVADDIPPAAVSDAFPVTAAPVATAVRPSPPPQARKGGLGQIIGIVLGALMAIPIVLGILIGLMWLGWPDKVGLRKALPQALGFLLPPKPAPAIAASPAGSLAAAGTGPMSLDDLASLADGGVAGDSSGDAGTTDGTPMPSPADFVDAFGVDAPGVGDTNPDSGTPLPGIESLPDLDDLPAAPVDTLAMAAVPQAGTNLPTAGLDILDELGIGSTPPAPPEPAPPEPVVFTLDTEALDEAAARAGGAFDAVAEYEDFADRDGKRRLIDWYRALARVGEELVVVEQAAADAGHPLAVAPDAVNELHDQIAGHPVLSGELGRLGRMWLRAASRDSDGIVVAGAFVSARRAGPWWISVIEFEEADGSLRELSVVSRSEPETDAGERIVATGILFADGVVWAGDVRPAARRGGWDAEPVSAEPVADPVAEPADDATPPPLEPVVDPFADPADDVPALPEF
jgi:hypothetical protein